MDYIIPLGMALLGLVGLTIYCLTVALRDTVKRMAAMNEYLLVIVGTQKGGHDVGRALVAASRKPKRDVPGIANNKQKDKKAEQPKKGYEVTVGAR